MDFVILAVEEGRRESADHLIKTVTPLDCEKDC
jgi:hypothetical protein